jgi:ubiquitin carboxyl-terminal hydrolase 14
MDDLGHYVGWSRVTNKTTVGELEDPNKQDWYRFDDDRVSVVEKSKILTLDGGGSSFSLMAKMHLIRS